MNNKKNNTTSTYKFINKVIERYNTHKNLCFENFSTDFAQIGYSYGFRFSPDNVNEVLGIYNDLINKGIIEGKKFTNL